MKKGISIFLFLGITFLSFLLRFWQLDRTPPSLYWDEISLGYNAYSISKTFYDEHKEFLPLARFIAFGDYKPPGYIYAAVLPIKLFGLNEFAVRFPSAIAGFFLVLITYFLVKKFFEEDKNLALLAALFVAISPWALQFSRGAFEANLAALWNSLGVLMFLYFIKQKKGYFFLLSLVFFIFSFYTFNANRIIAPLLLTGLLLFFHKSIVESKKWIIFSGIIGFLLLYPSFSYLSSRESRLRFQEVSIFNNLEIVEKANQRVEIDNSWWARILHNRRIAFFQEFLKHYFDNFSGRFLFISGDQNPRLSIQEVGELYLFDLPFLLIGIYFLLKKKNFATLIIFYWLLVVPIPAAMARETPHALRIVSILPLPQIISALGVYEAYQLVKEKYRIKALFILGIILALTFNFFYYLHNYYIHYPIDWSQEWQYGYKEAVNFISQIEQDYDQIIITEELGRPYIYFLFYQKVDPAFFWQTRIAQRDWWGFWTVRGFGKYKFGSHFLENAKGRILFVGIPSEIPKEANILKTINYLNGKPALMIARIEKF